MEMRHIRIKEDWISAISRNDISKIRDLYEQHGDDLLQVQSQGGLRPTGLHIACENGFLDVVKFLVEKGANGLAEDRWNRRPIHCAIYKGNLSVFQYLHDKDCGFNPIPNNDTPGKAEHFSAVAIKCGQLPVIKYLIKHGVKVPASGLYCACGTFFSLPIVKFLFSGTDEEDEQEEEEQQQQQHRYNLRRKKIKRDPMDGDGGSDYTSSLLPCFRFDSMEGVNALRQACLSGNRAIANYLIQHGVDVNKIGDRTAEGLDGYPTLTLACRQPDLLETVRLLLNHGADINARAARRNQDDDEVADSIEEEADVYLADVYSSPLAAALSNENEDIAAYLLQDFGSRLVTSPNDMTSYLILAAQGIGDEVMRLLCQRVASSPEIFWSLGKYGKNPLMTAIEHENMDAIKLLCTEHTTAENRIDCLDIVDSEGGTALSRACAIGDAEGVRYLYNNGASVTFSALKHAIRNDEINVVKYLCEETTVLDTENSIDDEIPGRTVLHVAAEHDDFRILRYLCENHLDKIDFNSQDTETGQTVMHEVAEIDSCCYGDDDYNMMQLLLSKGANPNLQDSAGCTPLHIVLKGYLYCLSSDDFTDDFRMQYLETACGKIRALLDANANPLCVDRDDRTPLHLALDLIGCLEDTTERFQEVFDRLSLGLVYDLLRAGGHHVLNRVCHRRSSRR